MLSHMCTLPPATCWHCRPRRRNRPLVRLPWLILIIKSFSCESFGNVTKIGEKLGNTSKNWDFGYYLERFHSKSFWPSLRMFCFARREIVTAAPMAPSMFWWMFWMDHANERTQCHSNYVSRGRCCNNKKIASYNSSHCWVVAGRPIRVEFLVPMERHRDSDCDLTQHEFADLPDMFESTSDDEAYTHSRFALPSQYQRAKLQEEHGKGDRYESDYAVVQRNPNHEK
jgi:hypothetical protein